jgi:hypothetical protein
MNRICEIEKDIGSAQALEQFAFGNSDALQRVQVMRSFFRLLVKQTIPPGQAVRPQLPLEILDFRLVSRGTVGGRQELQPDRIELQSPKTEHPLQRNGKIPTAFAILRCKAAAEEDGHASRIAILLARSRLKEQDKRPLGESDLE